MTDKNNDQSDTPRPQRDETASDQPSQAHNETFGDPKAFRKQFSQAQSQQHLDAAAENVLELKTDFGGGVEIKTSSAVVLKLDAEQEARSKFILTANHTVAEMPNWGFTFQSKRDFGDIDKDNDGQLLRQEIEAYREWECPDDELTKEWGQLREKRAQLTHLLEHFDQIQEISRDLDPEAKGVTMAGLDAFYKTTTRSSVRTKDGFVDVQVVASDPQSDLALLEVADSSQKHKKSFPAGLTISDEKVKPGDTVASVGYVDGKWTRIDSTVVGSDLEPDDNGKVSTFTTDKLLTPGTSGGPTIREGDNQSTFVGINHAHGSDTGIIVDSAAVRTFLAAYFASGKQIKRQLSD